MRLVDRKAAEIPAVAAIRTIDLPHLPRLRERSVVRAEAVSKRSSDRCCRAALRDVQRGVLFIRSVEGRVKATCHVFVRCSAIGATKVVIDRQLPNKILGYKNSIH